MEIWRSKSQIDASSTKPARKMSVNWIFSGWYASLLTSFSTAFTDSGNSRSNIHACEDDRKPPTGWDGVHYYFIFSYLYVPMTFVRDYRDFTPTHPRFLKCWKLTSIHSSVDDRLSQLPLHFRASWIDPRWNAYTAFSQMHCSRTTYRPRTRRIWSNTWRDSRTHSLKGCTRTFAPRRETRRSGLQR